MPSAVSSVQRTTACTQRNTGIINIVTNADVLEVLWCLHLCTFVLVLQVLPTQGTLCH